MACLTLVAIWAAVCSHLTRPWIGAIWSGFVLFGLVFDRYRYKPELTAPPGLDRVATNELDVDARGAVRVYVHPDTGERAYVRESAT